MDARIKDHGSLTSVAGRARAGRWARFRGEFPDAEDMRILDLGGSPAAWAVSGLRPRDLVVLNLDQFDSVPGVSCVVGDACEPPQGLLEAGFDLVYSNSLLEHVGGHERRRRLSFVIEAAAERHWVQTPYRYFPVEPHWMFPGFQFMPIAAQAWVAERWHLGFMRSSPDSAIEDALWTELVSITEMRSLFPSSDIEYERLAGFVKSLVAIRRQ